jgi:hypothetical protein
MAELIPFAVAMNCLYIFVNFSTNVRNLHMMLSCCLSSVRGKQMIWRTTLQWWSGRGGMSNETCNKVFSVLKICMSSVGMWSIWFFSPTEALWIVGFLANTSWNESPSCHHGWKKGKFGKSIWDVLSPRVFLRHGFKEVQANTHPWRQFSIALLDT